MSDAGPPSLAAIRRGLEASTPELLEPPSNIRDRASVAVVFGGPAEALSLCFIRRAQREDDRWSGHMAFPGGRASPEDASPEAVARRETREEVGLVLTDAQRLGRLSDFNLGPTGATGVLSPFAYYIGEQLPAFALEAAEVAAADWLTLAYLWSRSSKTTAPWVHQGVTMRFPGIAHGEHVIWGLTHRVLTRLAARIEHPLP